MLYEWVFIGQMNQIVKYFSGRLNRKNFLFAFFIKTVLFFLFALATVALGLSDEILWQRLIGSGLIILVWLVGVSICLRRCFDMDWNKWISVILSLLLSSPIAFGLGTLLLFFIRGSEGPNRYGEEDNGNFLQSVLKVEQ